jgi:2-polyprenyl-6-methoxyphenol hydroxylase-like FAD-dependent oxidoreductase
MLSLVQRSGSQHTDVAIVGAGPTGATAAIAFARRGARVTLIDGYPGAGNRFAGEWIHPPGVRALRRLGVDVGALAAREGHGLAIFGDDGGDPVCLPYDGEVGIARLHSELVTMLREHACGHAAVHYLRSHVFVRFEGNTLVLEDREHGRTVRLSAARILGADGRSSKVRAALGDRAASEQLSYMAGLEFEHAALPFEGLGHVFLGGPGPALLYRVDERRVRACLDIPVRYSSSARRSEAVYRAFSQSLPPQLEPALRAAVKRRFAWAATGVRRRRFFGKGDVWLAGDAIGHVHPLSGVGITLGVLDAEAAARAETLSAYREERDARVAEVLASVLYLAFSRQDASAVRIRHGLLRMLRTNAFERGRTMRLLTGDDRAGASFVDAFLRASGQVAWSGAERSASRRQSWSDWARHLQNDAGWLAWPLRACTPSIDPWLVRNAWTERALSLVRRPSPDGQRSRAS